MRSIEPSLHWAHALALAVTQSVPPLSSLCVQKSSATAVSYHACATHGVRVCVCVGGGGGGLVGVAVDHVSIRCDTEAQFEDCPHSHRIQLHPFKLVLKRPRLARPDSAQDVLESYMQFVARTYYQPTPVPNSSTEPAQQVC